MGGADTEISSSIRNKGNVAYMAPELLFNDPPPCWKESDIYAFVLLVLEVRFDRTSLSDSSSQTPYSFVDLCRPVCLRVDGFGELERDGFGHQS